MNARPERRSYAVDALTKTQTIGKFKPPYSRHTAWMYFDTPFTKPDVASLWLAHDGDDIGGNLGAIVQPALLSGAPTTSCFLMSLEVDPTWRRQGVASALLAKVHESYDLMLMLGMTPEARLLYERRGYLHVGRMVQMVRIYHPLAFLKLVTHRLGVKTFAAGAARPSRSSGRRWRLRSSPSTAVSETRPSLDELDELWRRLGPSHAFVAERSGAWVRWRYWTCPQFTYGEYYARTSAGALAGYAMTKRFVHPSGVRVGVIVDAFVMHSDATTFDALIGAAMKDLEDAGVDVIRCVFTSAWARRRLRRRLFVDPALVLPDRYTPGREVFVAQRGVSVPSTIDRWWLTRGDSEMDFNDVPKGSTTLPPRP